MAKKASDLSPFIRQLLTIVAQQAYRVDPYSPHEVPARSICDAIRIETQLSESEIDELLEELSAKES